MPQNKNRRNRPKRKNPRKPKRTVLERPFAPSRELVTVCRTQAVIQAAAADFVVFESRLMSIGGQGFTGSSSANVTTTVVGLADATPYALGRARHFDIEVNGYSYEGTNVTAVNLVFSDTQPSTTITTRALAIAASIGYLHTPIVEVGVQTGMGKFRIPKVSRTARQVVMDGEVVDDRDFVCGLNPLANSNQEVWVALIVTSQAAGIFVTLGLNATIEITTRYKAFSRLPGM